MSSTQSWLSSQITRHLIPLVPVVTIVSVSWYLNEALSRDQVQIAASTLLPMLIQDLADLLDFLSTYYLAWFRVRSGRRWIIRSGVIQQKLAKCLSHPRWKIVSRLHAPNLVTFNSLHDSVTSIIMCFRAGEIYHFALDKHYLTVTVHANTTSTNVIRSNSFGASQVNTDVEVELYSQTLFLSDIFQECSHDNQLYMYSLVTEDYRRFLWQPVKSLMPALLNQCILKQEHRRKLYRHLETFQSSDFAQICRNTQSPQKSCILLTGKPGTAKTSLANAIAQAQDKHLFNLSPSSEAQMSATIFCQEAMKVNWANGILLLDDADFFNLKDRQIDVFGQDAKGTVQLPNAYLSAFMNLLDGRVISIPFQVIIITNYPELLDPALLRPGRVDLRLHLDVMDEPEMFIEVWQRLFPHDVGLMDEKVTKTLIESKFTAAEYSTLLKQNLDDPEVCLDELLKFQTETRLQEQEQQRREVIKNQTAESELVPSLAGTATIVAPIASNLIVSC